MAQKPEATQPAAVNSISKDLEKALEFLKSKDDTSRFVGLALLKPLLEQELSRQSTTEEEGILSVIEQSWRAIPVSFLDRLLKAKPEGNRAKAEARRMVSLAVAVLHAFLTIVETPEEDERFVGRVPSLMYALRSTSPETTTQIMQILATLVTTDECSRVIFDAKDKDDKTDQKPESYIFVSRLLIDIRCTVPSLLEKLHSAEYADVSERVSREYDLISAFIGFLIRYLEGMCSDDVDEAAGSAFSAPMRADLLLKLRANISELMSLTIEYFRNRYDSSIAGAAGLDASARSLSPTAVGPLSIALDTSDAVLQDPVLLAQLRALSLWLHDEENDALRREASGIMDVLLALYRGPSKEDFRLPVLLSIEGIIEVPEGTEAFLREEGWAILTDDVADMFDNLSLHRRVIEIFRVLLAVVESDVTGPAKMEWMYMVRLAHRFIHDALETVPLGLAVAISQLAVELLVRAPRGIRKIFGDEVAEFRKDVETLLGEKDGVSGEDREGLEEVLQGFDSLKF